jgi:protein NRD1
MIDRKDAVAAREGMEQYKSGDMQLRVSISRLHWAGPITDKL